MVDSLPIPRVPYSTPLIEVWKHTLKEWKKETRRDFLQTINNFKLTNFLNQKIKEQAFSARNKKRDQAMEDVEILPSKESIAKLIQMEVKKALGNQAKPKSHGVPKDQTATMSTITPKGNNKGGNNKNQDKGKGKLEDKPKEVNQPQN